VRGTCRDFQHGRLALGEIHRRQINGLPYASLADRHRRHIVVGPVGGRLRMGVVPWWRFRPKVRLVRSRRPLAAPISRSETAFLGRREVYTTPGGTCRCICRRMCSISARRELAADPAAGLMRWPRLTREQNRNIMAPGQHGRLPCPPILHSIHSPALTCWSPRLTRRSRPVTATFGPPFGRSLSQMDYWSRNCGSCLRPLPRALHVAG
jgi:hypothetical protein